MLKICWYDHTLIQYNKQVPMEIPIKVNKDSGPYLFGQAVQRPALGLVCSSFKLKNKVLFKVSVGCAVGQNLILTSSQVMKHENCSPSATFLLRSADYKHPMTPEKIEEFLAHQRIELTSDLIKDDQGIALLRLPKGRQNPNSLRLKHASIGSIFEKESLVQEIKIVGYSIERSLDSSFVYQERKSLPGQNNEEVLKVRDEGSSTLQFLFGISFTNLVGSIVVTNNKVFAIVTGNNQVRLISESLYKFVENNSPSTQDQ